MPVWRIYLRLLPSFGLREHAAFYDVDGHCLDCAVEAALDNFQRKFPFRDETDFEVLSHELIPAGSPLEMKPCH